MSLFDQVRQQVKQTLGDAATTARDVGQNFGAQASAQLALKKLQIEANRKTHELGARVYEWHRAGTLVATGNVPREVSDLCHALDDIHQKTREEEAKLEAAKREAELRATQAKAPPTIAPSVTITETTITETPPQPASQNKITAPLTPLAAQGDTVNSQSHINALGPSVPGPAMPGIPSMPAPSPMPNSNPDMPAPGIPVPGGDLPSMPGIPSNPDTPPASPSVPSSPDVGPAPTMPGQPL